MKVLLTEEAKVMLIPLIVRTAKGAEDIINVTPAELLSAMEEMRKNGVTLSKQKGFWQGLAVVASIAGACYIYKNFKLKCKVADLEDTIALNKLKDKADDIISKFDSEEETYESEEA